MCCYTIGNKIMLLLLNYRVQRYIFIPTFTIKFCKKIAKRYKFTLAMTLGLYFNFIRLIFFLGSILYLCTPNCIEIMGHKRVENVGTILREKYPDLKQQEQINKK
ncbi:hypothetical protein FACS1894199_00360 [Bacteroidia bacterium]|nr:hypothetical protein FACS1894199_00360 [Bacteroidia bacterium]